MLHAMRPVPKPVKGFKKGKGKGNPPTPRQRLEKRADTLVREIVLDRDEYCVCPAPIKGHSNVYQCGHLITRGKESIKWDLFNCSVQCSGCNGRHRHYPELYTDYFLRECGKEEYHRLVQDSYVVRKLSLDELETLCSELTAIHRRQLDNPKWKPRFTQKQILSGEWRNERTLPATLPNVSNDYVLQTQPRG